MLFFLYRTRGDSKSIELQNNCPTYQNFAKRESLLPAVAMLDFLKPTSNCRSSKTVARPVPVASRDGIDSIFDYFLHKNIANIGLN
jgi:hypothetical protein